MNNKYLLIIIGILGVIIAFLLITNRVKNNTVVVDDTTQQVDNSQNNPPQDSWKTDTTFGIKYNSNWTVSPDLYRTPAEQANGQPEQLLGYLFTFPNNHTILWGGHQSGCTQSEFGQFQYGVSVVACVKGMRANVSVDNVRQTLTADDLTAFGDFVTKNK